MTDEEKYTSNIREPKLIAFYLPQFHPTPENDIWWGKGFTDWTNVTRSTPLFKGHYQPHLPSDLGFYDLRLRETRHDQIKLAKQYGIDGFCYHYYWFSGTRLLYKPLEDMLADPDSDMPFCLCWANENWTRRWDGADHKILIAQKYLPDDDLNFIKSLIPFFKDERYIHLDGKPFLIVYHPQHFQNAKRSVSVWRDYCRSIGMGDIHVCAAFTHGNRDYERFGFDSGVEFPPHNLHWYNINLEIRFHRSFKGSVVQYEDVAKQYLSHNYQGSRVFKTVFPSWDNTARAKDRALIVLNGTPDNYEYWLSSTIDLSLRNGVGEFVFINAWNEWAEGCHIEPDHRFGHGFLEATLNAKKAVGRHTFFRNSGLPLNADIHRRVFWSDLRETFAYHLGIGFGNLKFSINKRPWLRSAILPMVRAIRTLRAKFVQPR
ncbi:MAG: glycoside hydrolase family 99-like domain-containing protein [Deltaproteobacteria bacterium]|nr:glycoside hydrolase family 99-like domain-containing protein [Deltaproteobacteria bacterium]